MCLVLWGQCAGNRRRQGGKQRGSLTTSPGANVARKTGCSEGGTVILDFTKPPGVKWQTSLWRWCRIYVTTEKLLWCGQMQEGDERPSSWGKAGVKKLGENEQTLGSQCGIRSLIKRLGWHVNEKRRKEWELLDFFSSCVEISHAYSFKKVKN